jgi:hypothetical protein
MRRCEMDNVRLSDFYVETIKQTFKNHFGENDHLWIFGSRVEMHRKGGDIDLYVETGEVIERISEMKSKFVIELWKKLGEQKIDVVMNCLTSDFELPIYKVAREKGVLLV